ncbi:MAG: VWA domain-containing protein [Treponema sp.]|nr:VWA domain-containing protein [Treponema sp.]
MITKLFCLFIILAAGIPAFGQNLSLGPGDLRIELRSDGGFHLFIRRTPDIASVLLTESTRDPAMVEHSFAYRSREWNPVNGNEIRLLDGVPIPRESGIFSLVSSTPVSHPELGQAFHIYIPWVLEYGHPPGRHGLVHVRDGTYFNIRAFNLPFADYRGSFADNPFVLRALQTPPERPAGNFMAEAETAFIRIAQEGRGQLLHAATPDELVPVIERLLRQEAGRAVDIVICLDTTGSMGPYMGRIRAELVPMLREVIAEFSEWRIGMVRFKDYFEEYLTRVHPFTTDLSLFQRHLNSINIRGGGDIPEAVYEGLHDSLIRFPWTAESRLIILIGDAPPHPTPRGRITRDMVFRESRERNVRISAILLAE